MLSDIEASKLDQSRAQVAASARGQVDRRFEKIDKSLERQHGGKAK